MSSVVRVIAPAGDVQPDKLRVAAYCRVSSDSEDQQNSFIAQVEAYTERIESNPDWILADIYADEGLTGTRADTRTDFQRMLKDAEKGKIDHILTKAISRFSRNTRECLETVRKLRLCGVSVYFEKEGLDTSVLGDEIVLNIFASIAQEESISISQNMRMSYRQRMEKGEFITCNPPYGYRLHGRELVVDEQEAAVVKRIFTDYLSGKGILTITHELITDRVPRKPGDHKWDESTVTYILKNEKYIGDAITQKTYMTDTLPFQKRINRGEKKRYYIQNSQPPIISKATYQAAANLLIERSGQYCTGPEIVPNALNRRIVCGNCGSTFRKKCRADNKMYWVCRGHDKKKTNCPIKQIPEPKIHTAFLRMHGKLQKNFRYILIPLLDGLEALAVKNISGDTRIAKINNQILELSEQNLALNRLRTKGLLDSVIFNEQANRISLQITLLQKKRDSFLDREADDELIEGIRRVIAVMEKAIPTPGQFDELLFHRLVDQMIVHTQDAVTFRLHGGVMLTEPIQRSARR